MHEETSNRIVPANWLEPEDFSDRFPHPDRPLEIDVGFGKGRFLLARAGAHPGVNFLGIDRMLRRLRKVDRKATLKDLSNVRLMRLDAYYAVTYLVSPLTVTSYYIFFPDPWPKKRHHKYRLMNPPFMDALWRTLLPGGCFHFSTDHLPYFDETMDLVRADPRFEPVPTFVPAEEERTDFEMYYLDRKEIGRASFRKKA